MIHDPSLNPVPLGALKNIVSRCAELGQIELLRVNHAEGPADVLLMWSWLDAEAEKRYLRGGIGALRRADIGRNGRLWLLTLCAPGGPEALVAALRWASLNLSDDDQKERFRCFAPIEKGGPPRPVIFFQDGQNGGSIRLDHIAAQNMELAGD